MASYLPNGIGGATGANIATAAQLITTGRIIYVDSVTGDSSYTGHTRDYPVDSLTGAISLASVNDIIVCLQGHEETVSITVSLAGLAIVGEGSSNGQPTVELKGSGSSNIISVSAENVIISNLKFVAPDAAWTGRQLSISNTGSHVLVDNCRFEQDGNNDVTGVSVAANADYIDFSDCTWVSTATAAGSLPRSGMQASGNTAGMQLIGCTFDGGSFGWDSDGDGTANPYAADFSTGNHTNVDIRNLSLLNGAVANFSSASTGRVTLGTCTSGGRVEGF